jgi:hypothetical protein
MVTIFCNFRQFSAKNWRFSQKPMLALFWVKNAIFFLQNFWRKYFKNHNIGPRVHSEAVVSKREMQRRLKSPYIHRSLLCANANLLLCTFYCPGVVVMNTLFCDLCQFTAKKLAVFSKTNVMIKN